MENGYVLVNLMKLDKQIHDLQESQQLIGGILRDHNRLQDFSSSLKRDLTQNSRSLTDVSGSVSPNSIGRKLRLGLSQSKQSVTEEYLSTFEPKDPRQPPKFKSKV